MYSHKPRTLLNCALQILVLEESRARPVAAVDVAMRFAVIVAEVMAEDAGEMSSNVQEPRVVDSLQTSLEIMLLQLASFLALLLDNLFCH